MVINCRFFVVHGYVRLFLLLHILRRGPPVCVCVQAVLFSWLFFSAFIRFKRNGSERIFLGRLSYENLSLFIIWVSRVTVERLLFEFLTWLFVGFIYIILTVEMGCVLCFWSMLNGLEFSEMRAIFLVIFDLKYKLILMYK